MSVKHTFEISSTYRNRLLYPSQYEFTVNISESKHSDTSITALNPISLSYPIYNFQGITNNAMIGSDISGNPIGTYLKDYRGPGNPKIVNLGKPKNSNIYVNRDGYLEGLNFIHVQDSNVNKDNYVTTSSAIYKFYGTKFSTKLLNNKPTTSPPYYKMNYSDCDNKCILYNRLDNDIWSAPTDVPNTGNNTWFLNWGNTSYVSNSSNIFIHGGDENNLFYSNHYLEDVSIDLNSYNNFEDRFKQIIFYDGYSRKASLENPFEGWNISDKYRIRRKKPIVMGWGSSEPSPLGPTPNANSGTGPVQGMNGSVYEVEIINEGSGYNNTSGPLQVSGGNGTNLFINIIDIGNSKGKTNSIKKLEVAYPGSNYSIGDVCTILSGNNDCIIKIKNIGQSVDISNGFNTSNVTGNLSETYNQYRGQLLYISSRGPEYNNQIEGSVPEYYRQLPIKLNNSHISYDLNTTGSTPILSYITTVNTNNNIPGYDPDQKIGIVIIKGFNDVIPVNVNWEIQNYEKDGVTDFIYNGSKTGMDQLAPYYFKLHGLILPNISLKKSLGNKIAYYANLYVEIYNISSTNTCTNSLISNNKYAAKSTFKIPIKDISKPEMTRFIKFDSPVIQSIRFNINHDIKIKIYFEDGEVLESIEKDNAPPLLPNPNIQTSLLVSIER